jgi:hypothetical protein
MEVRTILSTLSWSAAHANRSFRSFRSVLRVFRSQGRPARERGKTFGTYLASLARAWVRVSGVYSVGDAYVPRAPVTSAVTTRVG